MGVLQTSLGNLLTALVALCVGQLSADPGTSKSKRKEAEGVGYWATPEDLGLSQREREKRTSGSLSSTRPGKEKIDDYL
ncbi:hypothetical protein Sjap_000891 [Stephania japonica]|uniref:Uncharacterized protein n=1 Tax=Stephania japonica TaxID=461633 RepID=A0AAP0KIZ0_9MAGN